MSTDHTTDASLRPLEGTIGSDPVETFGVLANEKRMAILLALWDGHDPLGDDEGLTFTELRERVGLVQGGEFNYHLSRLVDRLVDRTDGGYVLRPIARRILELVIAGTPTSTVLDPVPIDVPCPRCGGETAVSYQPDGELYHVCLECEGNFEWGENVCSSVHAFAKDKPPGKPLSSVEFEPAGVRQREPEELFAAGKYALFGHHLLKAGGVCDECYARTVGRLEVCPNHEDGDCDTCGRRSPSGITFLCTRCKEVGSTSTTRLARFHPAVIAFLYAQGVEIGLPMRSFETLKENDRLLRDSLRIDEEVIEIDPPKVLVTYRADDDAVSVTVDDELRVVEVSTTVEREETHLP